MDHGELLFFAEDRYDAFIGRGLGIKNTCFRILQPLCSEAIRIW